MERNLSECKEGSFYMAHAATYRVTYKPSAIDTHRCGRACGVPVGLGPRKIGGPRKIRKIGAARAFPSRPRFAKIRKAEMIRT
jgi:hypothetical protein